MKLSFSSLCSFVGEQDFYSRHLLLHLLVENGPHCVVLLFCLLLQGLDLVHYLGIMGLLLLLE